MPALSSTMTEGKIVEWLKKPGEKVGRGESVLVVESDKADMDVESFHEGYLAVVLMPEGSSAPVGETIGLIVESEEEIAAAQAKAPSPSQIDSPSPKGSKSGTIENQKSLTKTPSVDVGSLDSDQLANETKQSEAVKPSGQIVNTGRIIASPRAKKLATQLGVDLAMVRGTGPHGRIQAEDVQSAKGQPTSVPWIAESNAPVSIGISATDLKASPNNASKKTKPSLIGTSFGSPGESVSFNTLQQAVNRNMEASLQVPTFRVGYSIVTDAFDSFYKKVKPNGVTMTALLVKAVAITLARHPQVNVACSNADMTYPSSINVSVAVAMEDGGLITPVLKNADQLDLFELSRQWGDLVSRARNKQLQPDEYTTGTFTLSNLGMYGVDRFDAILPPGTGAILAVAASRPVVAASKDGSISVKRQMQVNLTADHRVIYGADGAAFLRDLADLIENRTEDLSS